MEQKKPVTNGSRSKKRSLRLFRNELGREDRGGGGGGGGRRVTRETTPRPRLIWWLSNYITLGPQLSFSFPYWYMCRCTILSTWKGDQNTDLLFMYCVWLVLGSLVSKDGRSDISRILMPSPYPTAGLCPKTLQSLSPLKESRSRSSQQSAFGSANATDWATKTQEKIRFRIINSGTCNESFSLPIIQESYFGQSDSDGEDESSALALESTPGSLCVV